LPESMVSRRECQERMAEAAKGFIRIENKVDGTPGNPGIEERLNTLITSLETEAKVREKEHKANTTRLNLIIALLALLATYIGIAISWHNSSAARSGYDIFDIFRAQRAVPVIASKVNPPEDAGGPAIHY
jgi:hypothetical protein